MADKNAVLSVKNVVMRAVILQSLWNSWESLASCQGHSDHHVSLAIQVYQYIYNLRVYLGLGVVSLFIIQIQIQFQ